MEPQHDNGVALSAFDHRTATAVVRVLRGAGVPAWEASGERDEVHVYVPDGQRDLAMRELGARMEEVHAAVQSAVAQEEPHAVPPARTRAPLPDPDDVEAGPPLVMERFRSMRYLAAVVMAPLLVVTLAPTIRGSAGRTIVLVLIGIAIVAVLAARRRS